MTDPDEKVLSDDDDPADALLGKRGGGRLPWTLFVLLLIGAGAAGAYYFRDYDAMRVRFAAAEYHARSDAERVAAAERTARAADQQAEAARATLENERRTFRDERAALVAERDRLRTSAGAGASATGSVPGGDALVVSLRQALTPGTGDVNRDASAVTVSVPARALFGPTGSTLSASGGALLDRVAGALRGATGAALEVRAYIPGAGAAAAWDATGARAGSVARRLAERGSIAPARILVVPATAGAPAAGTDARVELVLTAAPTAAPGH